MKKVTADKIAFVMARDVLRSSIEECRVLNKDSALDLADFIQTLSTELQKSMDDSIKSSEILNAYKNQSYK